MPRASRLLLCLLAVCLAAPVFARDKFVHPGPVRLDREGEKWAQKTLKKLTLEQKIGQMMVGRVLAQFVNVDSPQYQQLRDTVRKYHIGGLGMTVPVDSGFLQKAMPFEVAVLLNQLQSDSELPLLVAADFEYGLTMRINGATQFPYPMAFGAAQNAAEAEAFGRIVAEESRAIGVHWNWFPTADVNSNPANPIINTRSFGEDPKQVGEMVSAYIRGAHWGGMLTTAKHFPGHGDTATDSHLGLASVTGDMERLQTVELPPFQAAVNAGVDSVMVAHVTIPALEPDPNRVATTSPRIVTGLLKEQMKFQGLVVTDALDMNGLMRIYSGSPNPSGAAAVAAIKAGNDMILIPGDLDGAYRGLLDAVRRGEIPESQINASVLKILRAKASLGLHKARRVDLANLPHVIARPESIAVGQEVAQQAVTLVRDNRQLLPLRASPPGTSNNANPYTRFVEPANRVVAVVFTDDVRSEAGRAFARELRVRVPDATVFYVDPRLAGALSAPILSAVAQAQAVIVPVYVAPVSGKAVKIGNEMKNTVSLVGDSAALLQRILAAAGQRTAVLAMGNPYLGSDFPEVQVYLCTFSNLPVSESAAVKALFGEISIRGRLPISIPNVAQRGAGIDRPQATMAGGSDAQRNPTTAAR